MKSHTRRSERQKRRRERANHERRNKLNRASARQALIESVVKDLSPRPKPTVSERQLAKAVNFGFATGMGGKFNLQDLARLAYPARDQDHALNYLHASRDPGKKVTLQTYAAADAFVMTDYADLELRVMAALDMKTARG